MMLTKFTVNNFRSFATESSLDLSPGNCKVKSYHIQDDTLKSAAIFGANSSGKSNFIKAIKIFKNIVTDPYFVTKDPISCLDYPNNKKTDFQIEININEYCYRYSLSVITTDLPTSKISQQSFSYLRTDESLEVSKKNKIRPNGELYWSDVFEPIHVNIGDNKNSDEWLKTMQVKEKLKSKITLLKERLKEMTDSFDVFDTEYSTQLSQYEFNSDEYKKLQSRFNRKNDEITLNRQILFSLEKEYDKINSKLNKLMSDRNAYLPTLFTKRYSKPGIRQEIDEHVDRVYKWIVSSLVILEPDDFHMPLDDLDLLSKLSKIVTSLDVGIKELSWQRITESQGGIKTLEKIKNNLGEKNSKRLELGRDFSIHNSNLVSMVIPLDRNMYRISYWIGAESIYELVVSHDGSNIRNSKLSDESDGTLRVIELASMFIPTSEEKVYIIDELDRRLHPNLTFRIVEEFLNHNFGNKQLIFTTHESRLLTTELFRPDELWLVQRHDGTSKIMSLIDVDYNPRRRIDTQYLYERNLPGVPNSLYFLKSNKC